MRFGHGHYYFFFILSLRDSSDSLPAFCSNLHTLANRLRTVHCGLQRNEFAIERGKLLVCLCESIHFVHYHHDSHQSDAGKVQGFIEFILLSDAPVYALHNSQWLIFAEKLLWFLVCSR